MIRKAKTSSSLVMNKFLRVSNFQTTKEMWDILQVTHECTDEVKRSKLNTLSQEYEMFMIFPGEKTFDLKKKTKSFD